MIFASQSEMGARVELGKLDENRTLEEAVGYAVDCPYVRTPSWMLLLGLWGREVSAVETVTFHPELELPVTCAISGVG